MNLDATWLLLSLVPSGIGFVLFTYGKKQSRWPQLAAGIAFMIYPYFTDTVNLMGGRRPCAGRGALLGAAGGLLTPPNMT